MTFFIAIDGDDVGPAIRERIVKSQVEEAAQLSTALQQYFAGIARQLTAKGAHIVFSGGDSILAKIDAVSTTSELAAFYLEGPCTISIGIASTPETAYLALQLAKARGKNQAVLIEKMQQETIFWG